MKRITAIILLCFLTLTLFAGCENSNISTTDGRDVEAIIAEKAALEIKKVELDKTLKYFATIEIEDYGKIKLELDQMTAPITVANFVSLAQSGFYDNLTFHRIMDGFMMQGGDPEGTGLGGAKETIKGEFTNNGHYNSLSHQRGVISMARSSNSMDSASSQFFIVHKDSTFLDGDYAAFGWVLEGMDVVDAICNDARPTDNNGTIPASQQPIIKKVTITTEKNQAYIDAQATAKENQEKINATVAEKEALEITKVELDKSKVYFATIEIENYGNITVELDHYNAPITVANFISLAKSGFYDNLTFHRIMDGFMMQGGDPKANGTGGAKEEIKGEFSANGHRNGINHHRGVISMARANDYNSASSQFFIMHKDSSSLNGLYASFGYVTEGMDVVDAICKDAKPTDNNGTIPYEKQPKIKTVTITEKDGRNLDSIINEKSELEIKNSKINEKLDYFASIDIEGYGVIKLQLDYNAAPITVGNFVNLAKGGFYDNLTFHRIIDSFMIQGGDPEGNGMGGSKETIKGEFSANGHENSISHKRGVISMARATEYDSASSQFFIVHQDSTFLDGQYAAFGWVVEGMDIVDAICGDSKPIDSNGSIAINRQPVINTITITTQPKE